MQTLDTNYIPLSDQSESLYKANPTEDNQKIIYCYQDANTFDDVFCDRPPDPGNLYRRSYKEQ